ncbi:Apoptosis-stimulating of p53 protein 2 [Hypsibius exemplaris]|uniref:Apoptosis-stimulating of p53 protein 2 n=1 Tax=Hypsibius exemplaris TaxID=2072580 RepID=A0A1W0WPG5_HYPEX|nr:Apoptosis-stimulating of p53 protein 2 [Hypsibius exemplaris]
MVESTSNNGLDHLSVEELTAISSRQSHHLRMQRQNVLSKEERLKNLIAQYHRHEQKLDNLKHIRATLQAQESRLRDLKQLKQQVDQQATVNNQLGDELEKSKSVFANREKELAEAVAKVDILTAQLDRGRTTPRPPPSTSTSTATSSNAASENAHSSFMAAEIDRLKQEQRYRSHIVQQQKRKIDDKDASLLQKTLERNQLDLRINEISDRLNKRKVQILSATSVPAANGGGAQKNGARPPLAASAGGRDPAKVATVEPYSQRLNNTENYDMNTKKFNGYDTPPEPGKDATPRSSLSESAPSAPAEMSAQPTPHTKEKAQQRIELILRETSNLPNLVTDTLMRDGNNADYLRSSGTPDTYSSSSDGPSVALPSVVSEPTPPKASHHHRSGGAGATLPGHQTRPKETASSSGSQVPVPSVKSGRRVKFDPQALLLDASLEGELELVVKTVQQVMDPSASNDEGITALHNAICAGHFAIVKFLVEYGCDVNAQDTDGWSPLHCAASCNNLSMCRFLIEHGACVYATTHSDHESASQKCEEDEADYEGCSQYLLETLHQLGRVNDGIVYAVYDYQAQNADELSFQCGEKMKVLRLSDDDETEWYWAERLSGLESAASAKTTPVCGYIPRNLLALYPRVRRTQRSK